MRLRKSAAALLFCCASGCSEGAQVEPPAGSGSGDGGGGASSSAAGMGASPGDGGGGSASSSSGGGGSVPSAVFSPIGDHHRFVPGQMFGGWGPHLGHLVRAGGGLWLADDYCAQGSGPGACDALDDHTLAYYQHEAAGWVLRDTIALPGQVQQNTGTIASADGTRLHSYGIDVAAGQIVECSYEPGGGPLGCAALPFTLPAGSNYVGAALSPLGYRMVWWTVVQDGGGGSFHYVVDYGGGWNGPRSGDCAGYNDASYIDVAFGGASQDDFTMHVQLVSGLAPNWSFLGAVGYGNLAGSDPVSWANALAPLEADPILSTNDVWIDPASNDTHLVARSTSGAAVYYHRPLGGSWSAPLFALPAYRARFVVAGDALALVYGPPAGDLAYRVAQEGDRPAGQPIAWAALSEVPVALPSDFGQIYAIYPESPTYQLAVPEAVHVAVVGAGEENVVAHVAITP